MWRLEIEEKKTKLFKKKYRIFIIIETTKNQ